MSNILKAAMRGVFPSGEVAEAIDLDGTNDYFSRASDFTGNADGKTFTFSAWVWVARTIGAYQFFYRSEGAYFYVGIDSSNNLEIVARNSGSTQILLAEVSLTPQLLYSFVNILVSCDLANASNRSVYINDVAQSVTWTTYTNDTIDFTRTAHAIGATDVAGGKLQGRLSNVFLAYEYVDLSVEANRRIFITADRKPA